MFDAVIIHAGAQHGIYGPLSANLTAVEPPTWARMISGWLRDNGFTINILDQEAERVTTEAVATFVRGAKARLVVIVVAGHQPSASTQQMTESGLIARTIKGIDPDQKIIMIGNHPSALPIQTLEEEAVDFVCDGEGPLTIQGLLNNDSLESIPGLIWWSGSDVICNKTADLIPIDELHGDVWDLLPMKAYRAHQWQCFGNLSARQPYASIYTTLGCPHSCKFCMINVFQHGNKYRMRNPIKVVDQIETLYYDYGVSTIKIADEMFVLAENHYTAICHEIIKRGLGDKINFWAYSRVDTVRSDKLALLRAAGVRWLALGIESASEYVRDGAQKRLKENDILKVVRAIQAADINVIGNFIVGLPDDDLVSMQATLNLALELNCEFANFYSAMAYPGSPLYNEAKAKNWTLPASWRGYSQHNDDCRPLDTRHVSAAAVLKFRDEAFNIYFSNPVYQKMIASKFGLETLEHVRRMCVYKLDRRLVRETYAPEEAASHH